MGQIVINDNQIPKYCNLVAIQSGGSKVNTVLDSGEIWFVDSTNSNKSRGTGRYDSYIIGDGIKKASELSIIKIDPIPTALRQLSEDSDHRTVSDLEKAKWNRGGGEGGSTVIADNEDLEIVDDVIQLKDKEYAPLEFSGYGRKYLRRKIIDTHRNRWESTDNEPITGSLVNLSGTVGQVISPSTTGIPRASMSYFKIPVVAGEIYKIKADKADKVSNSEPWVSRFWSVTDTNGTILNCYKSDVVEADPNHFVETSEIEIEQDGWLWINYINYYKVEPVLEKYTVTEEEISINTATQEDFVEPNTIYVIQYDYDLNNKVISLPENSVLYFNGGSIRNGSISGNKATIISSRTTIFTNIELLGTWKNIDFYPEWFGAVGDGVTDDTQPIQTVLELASIINSKVRCILDGKTYLITKGLVFVSNTDIIGGTLIANFENLFDWVLQTKTLYTNNTGTSKLVGYKSICAWGDFDGGHLNMVDNCLIDSVSIKGKFKKDENNKYKPIYGGLKIQATNTVHTRNVTIDNVGYGLARGTCIKTVDEKDTITACFGAFVATSINGLSIRDCYLNVTGASAINRGVSTTTGALEIVPYGTEYQDLTVHMPGKMKTIIEGNGGIDDSDETLKRPSLCSIKIVQAESVVFENTIVDGYCDVGIASEVGGITLINPWWERVHKAYVYGYNSRIAVIMPLCSGKVEYDLIVEVCRISLISCEGRITCSGGTTGEQHKGFIDNAAVYFVGERINNGFEDKFHYLTTFSYNEIYTLEHIISEALHNLNDRVIALESESNNT